MVRIYKIHKTNGLPIRVRALLVLGDFDVNIRRRIVVGKIIRRVDSSVVRPSLAMTPDKGSSVAAGLRNDEMTPG
jgi:hypothetical protein